MARTFAGILGPMAFLTCLARGAVHGQPAEATLWTAWIGLLALSAVGYVVGWVAGWTIEESVGARMVAELSANESNEPASSSGGAT